MATTTEQTLTSEHRTAFWALADVLIPATDAMPSASQAGSAEKWLDRALAARPDLVAPLAAVLDAAAGRDPEAEARRLHAEDPDGFSALAQIASGGGGSVSLIAPRSNTGSRSPSRRSYSASSEKGTLFPWPGYPIRFRILRFM
jgi:hypothetical protein